ncbi:L,D-transpeptidase catalytic domain-containing protein [Chitinivibrio alkaliphilus ACht1]|uniref:L,D-transpeptidase catalytic domain-containing protein n=2 Tax=Chitinivibrio TaxID=1505231 RepID=U7D803_9BACT|nr:L,D-transpeptidase catalytic domain-containing protein [Chitinivibrio alkaliphilus ACht1]
MESMIRRMLLRAKRFENHVRTTIDKWRIRSAYEQSPLLIRRVFLALGAFIVLSGIFVSVALFLFSTVGERQVDANRVEKNGVSSHDDREEQVDDTPVDTSLDSSQEGGITRTGFRSMGEDFSYILVADKNDRVLHVLQRDGLFWNHTRTFPVASGSRPGMKMYEGDLRTPQGIYFIIQKKSDEELYKRYGSSAEIYGPYSFVLNYPNRHDIAAGRTGSGIWIHGTTPDEVPVSTRGCLAVHNDNLKKLYDKIYGHELIPVLIHENGGLNFEESVDLENIMAERTYLVQERENAIAQQERKDSLHTFFVSYVDSWKEAWESMDTAVYAPFYDAKNLDVPGHTWESWIAHKQSTFERYDRIEIQVDSPEVKNMTDTTVSLVFNQTYESEVFRSVSRKRLDLLKRDGSWRIVSEVSVQ